MGTSLLIATRRCSHPGPIAISASSSARFSRSEEWCAARRQRSVHQHGCEAATDFVSLRVPEPRHAGGRERLMLPPYSPPEYPTKNETATRVTAQMNVPQTPPPTVLGP